MIAGTKYDLTEPITKVKRASEEAGLYLNVKKTKVMATGKLDHIIVGDNKGYVHVRNTLPQTMDQNDRKLNTFIIFAKECCDIYVYLLIIFVIIK